MHLLCLKAFILLFVIPCRSILASEWEAIVKKRAEGGHVVVVTGGAGCLGLEILRQLLRSNNHHHMRLRSVRVLDRIAGRLSDPRVEYCVGDICDTDFVQKIVNGAHCVIHTAGIVDPSGFKDDKMFDVHFRGTENVIYACRRSPNSTDLVRVSSVGVVESWKDFVGDEGAQYPSGFLDSYAFTKHLAEKAVLESNGLDGVMTCILRFPIICGPESYVSEYLYRFRHVTATFGPR
jgi:nucleoside-diphosphate-sugar epimerase